MGFKKVILFIRIPQPLWTNRNLQYSSHRDKGSLGYSKVYLNLAIQIVIL
jgi:hypothetical protein